MKNFVKVLACIVAIIGLQSVASAQNFAYSITDNNQDASGRFQQLYRINVTNGETTYIGDLRVGAAGTTRIIREYEGLASIGGVVYGISEYAGLTSSGVDCNTGDDPVTGLSSDLRTFRNFLPVKTQAGGVTPQTVPDPGTPTPAPVQSLVNGINNVVGPQIGETCINGPNATINPDGGTEAGTGYNALDGNIYTISSDDNFAATGIRSRLYRVSPTSGLATFVANITNPDFLADGGDEFPYLDGMSIFPSGVAFASEARFSIDPNAADPDNRDAGGLYIIELTNGDADFCKYLFPTDLNVDTGLAHRGSNQLFVLNERGIVYQTTTACIGNPSFPTGSPVSPGTAMRTTGATSGAGGGAAGLRIAGCRGAVTTTPEFEPAGPSVGGCRDFEGFDIPVPSFK